MSESLWACVCVKSLQSCLTLWVAMDYSPSGSSVLGILQAVKYWSGLSCPPSGDLLDPWIKITSTCGSFIARRFFTVEPLGKVMYTFSSVQFSSSVMSDSLRPHKSQHARPPCPSLTPRVHSNSCLPTRWCHPAISSSVVPFSSCPQSLPASESLPMSQLFAWGGQSTGVSALASVLPMNTQDQLPLEWTGWISLQSKGLSRVFFNTTVKKHQFFGTQLSSQSNSHIHTWPQEKP